MVILITSSRGFTVWLWSGSVLSTGRRIPLPYLYICAWETPGSPNMECAWWFSPLEHSANFLLSSVSPAPGAVGYLMPALPSKLSLKHHWCHPYTVLQWSFFLGDATSHSISEHGWQTTGQDGVDKNTVPGLGWSWSWSHGTGVGRKSPLADGRDYLKGVARACRQWQCCQAYWRKGVSSQLGSTQGLGVRE